MGYSALRYQHPPQPQILDLETRAALFDETSSDMFGEEEEDERHDTLPQGRETRSTSYAFFSTSVNSLSSTNLMNLLLLFPISNAPNESHIILYIKLLIG
jgi:hypothetical protein